jgi:hypothetical protein
MAYLGNPEILFNTIRDDEGLLNSEDMFLLGQGANLIKNGEYEELRQLLKNVDPYIRGAILSAVDDKAYPLLGFIKIN